MKCVNVLTAGSTTFVLVLLSLAKLIDLYLTAELLRSDGSLGGAEQGVDFSKQGLLGDIGTHVVGGGGGGSGHEVHRLFRYCTVSGCFDW